MESFADKFASKYLEIVNKLPMLTNLKPKLVETWEPLTRFLAIVK